MTERIKLNTKFFKEKYKDIYSQFFLFNNKVFSGCFNVPWNPNFGKNFSKGIGLKSNIGAKCYVGIQKNEKLNYVSFGDLICFNLNSKEFDKINYYEINKEAKKLEVEIINFLKENNYNKGIKINMLSEVARGHNFSFSGTSLATLSLSLHVLVGKLDIDLLNNYDDFVKSDIFNEIFYFAWKMELISRYGNALGVNVKMTLLNKSSQYLYLLEEYDTNTILDEYKDKKIIDYFLDEKFSDTILGNEPVVDHYIVFSGLPTNTKYIEDYKSSSIKSTDKLKDFIGDVFEGEDNGDNFTLKQFLKSDSIYDNITSELSIVNIKIVESLKKLLEVGEDKEIISELINSVNCLRHNTGLLEKQSEFAEDFKSLFLSNRHSKNEKIGIVPIYSGKLGGGYIVITNKGLSRDTILKTISDIKIEYPNAEVEFSSHEDGYSSDGIKIEQYISKGIYSDFVKEGSVEFKSNYHNNYVGDYNDIIQRENDILLLDMIGNKVYFKGKKLTSKDISSQAMTIEVLSKVIDSDNLEINNSDLRYSSYTTNKNDMTGKIILPLVKFLETNTNTKFPLTCTGSLTKFSIKLGKTQVKIGIIKEL